MADRYHINRSGEVALCRAQVKPCPLIGAEHGDFESEKEARDWAEGVNAIRAGGERNFLGIRRKKTPQQEAKERTSAIDLANVYSQKSLRETIAKELGIFEHDVVVSSSDEYSLNEGDEIYVNDRSGKILVFTYENGFKGLSTNLTKEARPVALVNRQDFTEAVLTTARLDPGDPAADLKRAFFVGEVEQTNSPSRGKVYGLHDGIEQRYFDSKLNDVTEEIVWEKTERELAKSSHSRLQSRAKAKPKYASNSASGIAVPAPRKNTAMANARTKAQAKKPRRTLKWHGEQPISASEAAIYNKVARVELVRDLPSAERAAFLEAHGERSSRDLRTITHSMKKKRGSAGAESWETNDAGSFFDRSGREVQALSYSSGNSDGELRYRDGSKETLRAGERKDLYYLPTGPRVLQAIRDGYGDQIKQNL